jgi:hypothetical protein
MFVRVRISQICTHMTVRTIEDWCIQTHQCHPNTPVALVCLFGDDECLCMRACRGTRPQEGYVAIQTAESRIGLTDTHQ